MMSTEVFAQPRWRVYLRLGRVSNLPTIWTNCLAGTLLAGGKPDGFGLPLLALSISLLYVAGMFLNDAFDQNFDSRYRRERPIPSGEITGTAVYAVGFGLLLSGLILFMASASLMHRMKPELILWPVLLCALIVYYDSHHKSNPVSPLIMGLCRVLVYLCAASVVASAASPEVLMGSAALLAYMIGLTYVAKQENLREIRNLWPLLFLLAPLVLYGRVLLSARWTGVFYVLLLAWILYSLTHLTGTKKNIPRTVVSLIAGISLLDALLIASTSSAEVWAWAGVAGFVLTLAFQRYVPGT